MQIIEMKEYNLLPTSIFLKVRYVGTFIQKKTLEVCIKVDSR